MTRTSLDHLNCSWAQSAEVFADKWSLMIIRDAFYGVKSFSAFAANIGVSKNILAQRLAHLQQHGVLEKRPVGLGSSRHEYCLTDKGRALFPVIMAIGQWADEWIFGPEKAPLVVVDKRDRDPIRTMTVTASDGRELGVRDVTFVAGPGASDSTRTIADAIANRSS